MREEYEFTSDELRNGERGKYVARFQSDALAVLEKLIGTTEAPSDWAAEHEHYLYGTPKRADPEP